MRKICEYCQNTFTPHVKAPHQKTCGSPECLKKHKTKLRKERMKDEDYKENRRAAQKKWTLKNPNYSRDYRKKNPAYTEANRQKQRKRNESRLLQNGSSKLIVKTATFNAVVNKALSLKTPVLTLESLIAKTAGLEALYICILSCFLSIDNQKICDCKDTSPSQKIAQMNRIIAKEIKIWTEKKVNLLKLRSAN